MTDQELIDIFSAKLLEIKNSNNISLPLVQLNQPTTQGIDGTGAIYFTFLPNYIYGWGQNVKTISDDPSIINDKETRQILSDVQISVRKIMTPGSMDKTTARDIASLLAIGLSSRNSSEWFRSNKVGILKISNIANFYFENGEMRFEMMPNFLITFTHTMEFNSSIGRITSIDGDVKVVPGVIDGQ